MMPADYPSCVAPDVWKHRNTGNLREPITTQHANPVVTITIIRHSILQKEMRDGREWIKVQERGFHFGVGDFFFLRVKLISWETWIDFLLSVIYSMGCYSILNKCFLFLNRRQLLTFVNHSSVVLLWVTSILMVVMDISFCYLFQLDRS